MSRFAPYDSARVDSKKIRVVHVAAGHWHDPIRCTLFRRGLDEASDKWPYKALSYVWGSSKVTETIDLEGHPFEITLNLSCALRHLRKVDQSIRLWVDALCINQQDQQERSLQVGIMQFIYKSAEEVVVFMGDGRGHRVSRSQLMESPYSPTIILHGVERDESFLSEMLNACDSSKPRELSSSLMAPACAIGLLSLFSDHDAVERVCTELMRLKRRIRYDLFERLKEFVVCPWWSRIWVVQEVAVGTAVTIRYGTITISWEAMVAAAGVWSLLETRKVATNVGIEPENLKVLELFVNQLTGLEQTRRKWRAEGGTDLVRLLHEFSDRHATDDRDKVYGVLSLAKQDQQYIKPSYELDVYETYKATALALIHNGGTLAYWAGDQKRKFNRGLPSWIPDWSTAVAVGDKRRMDLFHYYGVSRGWSIRVIDSELAYWAALSEQMELLLKSQAGQTTKLPASLRPFVQNYIVELTRRIHSFHSSKADTEEIGRWALHPFIWDKFNGTTLTSMISRLKWHKQHRVFRLLQRRIREFEKREDRDFVPRGGVVYSSVIDESSVGEQIHQDLQELATGLDYNDPEINTTRLNYGRGDRESAINEWVIQWESEIKKTIILVISRLINQCRRLSSLCQASGNEISPDRLFQACYSLRGPASSPIESLVARAKRSVSRIPPQIDTNWDPLRMPTLLVDAVTDCGRRQFGWADTKSSLTTLVSWLSLSSSLTAVATAEEKEIQLERGRIRQFAKTIIGGACRRNGSYQEADDSTLGPLEDWLRSVMLRPGRSPEIEKSALPPSPLFEDIQIATDDRVFFLTKNGSMGLGPASMRKGDTIHVFPNGSAHFVLRNRLARFPKDGCLSEWATDCSSHRFELIGDCYLHTNGELENRGPTEEEPVVEGSLPFELLEGGELLGITYLRKRGLPIMNVNLD